MKQNITAQEVQFLLLRVYKRYKKGEIGERTANKETYILNSVLKTIEIADHEERINQLENLLSDETYE